MTAAAAPLSRDWPHGWEIVRVTGQSRIFTVLGWDVPGAFPIIGHTEDGDLWRFLRDGTNPNYSSILRNAPAPRASGTDWVVRFQDVTRFEPTILWFNSESDARAYVARELSGSAGNLAALHVAIKRLDWTEGDGLEPQP